MFHYEKKSFCQIVLNNVLLRTMIDFIFFGCIEEPFSFSCSGSKYGLMRTAYVCVWKSKTIAFKSVKSSARYAFAAISSGQHLQNSEQTV